MIAISMKDDASLVDVITASTAAAVVFSAIYNYGYFAAFESSFISTLTFQDFVVGAALALIPSVLSVQAMLWVGNSIVNWTTYSWIPIGLSVLVYGGLAAFHISEGSFDYLAQLAYALVYTAGLIIFIRMGIFSLSNTTNVMSLIVWAYIAVSGLGKASYLYDTSNYKRADTSVTTNNQQYEGRLIRATSNFLLLFNGTSVTAIPMADVQSIRSVKWRD